MARENINAGSALIAAMAANAQARANARMQSVKLMSENFNDFSKNIQNMQENYDKRQALKQEMAQKKEELKLKKDDLAFRQKIQNELLPFQKKGIQAQSSKDFASANQLNTSTKLLKEENQYLQDHIFKPKKEPQEPKETIQSPLNQGLDFAQNKFFLNNPFVRF